MFKLDIGDPKSKKTFHLETASEAFLGKKIGDVIKGSEIKEHAQLSDYEFIITGASDNAGFPSLAFVEGSARKRVLLKRGKGMKQKKPKGLRLRKTIHGNIIGDDIVQINLKVSKQGAKLLEEVFKKPEEKKEEVEEKSEEVKKEAKILEKKPAEEKKEEKKEVGEKKPEAEPEEKAEAIKEGKKERKPVEEKKPEEKTKPERSVEEKEA